MGDDLELRDRIEHFDVDAGAQPGYFVEKLAYENDWTAAFAERVLVEYRRYVYLACTAGHVVVPSDEVDMAWHQHLLDTEQYWGEFCQSVLRRPLHHRPNKGGSAGQQTHLDHYQMTLDVYERTFACEPPGDVWPPAAERFAREPIRRRVSRARHSLALGKARRGVGVGLLIVLAVVTTVAWADPSIGAPPFDSPAPNGVALTIAFVIAALIAVGVSHGLRGAFLTDMAASAPDAASVSVEDPYDAAVLNANTQHAVNVAVAALVRDGALAVGTTNRETTRTYCLTRSGPLPAQSHSLERATYGAVSAAGAVTISEVHDAVRPEAKRILESLRERTLLRPNGRFLGHRLMVASPILLMVILSSVAIRTAGINATVFMVILDAVLVMIAIGLATSPPQLTTLGADALEATRAKHPPMSFVGLHDVADGRALSWIVALQGAEVLKASLFALRAAISAPAAMGGGGRGVRHAGCGGGSKRVAVAATGADYGATGTGGCGGGCSSYGGSGGGSTCGGGCSGGGGCGSGCGGGCGSG